MWDRIYLKNIILEEKSASVVKQVNLKTTKLILTNWHAARVQIDDTLNEWRPYKFSDETAIEI